jgi:hypothetical protein
MPPAAVQTAFQPPSTDKVAPWILDASSLARNATVLATSSGLLIRRDGTRAIIGAMCSANSAVFSVAVGPGATVLTRTPDGPYSSAQDLVSEWTCPVRFPARDSVSAQHARVGA